MNSTVKSIIVWACIIAFGMVLISWVTKGAGAGKTAEIGYSDLLDKIEAGQVQDATIQGTDVRGHLKGSKDEFHTTISGNTADNLAKELHAAKTHFDLKDPQSNNFLMQMLFNLGPLVLLVVLFFFFMRQMQAGGNKAMSFGKSRARLLSMQQKNITFKDVAGVDEAKEELKEIIEYL